MDGRPKIRHRHRAVALDVVGSVPVRIHILAIGKLKDGPERAWTGRYAERVAGAGRGCGITECVIVEFSEARDRDAATRKSAEAATLLEAVDKLGPGVRLVALDEHGGQATSAAFAKSLQSAADGGTKAIVYAIGGPDGHGPALLAAAHDTLALSAMTLPHGLARMVLIEQIYRAVTILSGHPYHRP